MSEEKGQMLLLMKTKAMKSNLKCNNAWMSSVIKAYSKEILTSQNGIKRIKSETRCLIRNSSAKLTRLFTQCIVTS